MDKIKSQIAAMTVFCHELFRLEAWKHYYDGYKDLLSLHVIINNGNPADTKILKEFFPNSVVLESEKPNLLAAYNVGLKYIFRHKDIKAIMQITNDVEFAPDSIEKMLLYLEHHETIGAVGPVLCKAHSDIVESAGFHFFSPFSYQRPIISNITFSALNNNDAFNKEAIKASFVPAGAFMVRRKAWEKVGLQDEKLNMYQDERDFALRLQKEGYSEIALLNVQAWHQHVNAPGRQGRRLYVSYYASRNTIYVTRKHFGNFWPIVESILSISYNLALSIYHLIRLRTSVIIYDLIRIKGLWHGLWGIMNKKPPK